jgi:hypothetical protein
MSTISRERNEALNRLAQMTHHFQDDKYTLAAFRLMEDRFVFLYDDDQRSLFLGQQTQAIDLLAFWEKHRENASYCIACELMLCFDERWIAVPGEPSVELGIDTGTAKRLLAALRGEMPSLEYMDVGDV